MGQIEDSSKAATMRAVAVLGPLVVCLVTSAPYNEVQPSQPSSARLDSGSVHCVTEYTTVWDTQYQEKETQECVTKYEKVCQTVTERLCKATTRQECSTVYEDSCRTVYKSVCVESTRLSTSPTLRLSAPRSTRTTVSPNGKVRVIIRSGLPSPAPASRTPTTAART